MSLTQPASVADPAASASRARRLTGPLLLAGGVLAVSVALHVRDPHRSGSWGACPWLLLTGTACPGCGGLRAVNDLTRGDVVAAASSNLLLVAALPVAAGLWLRTVARRWQGPARRTARLSVPLVVAAVLVLVAFTVVRNTAWGSWLAP